MNKSLVAAILGLISGPFVAHGDGRIRLYSYNTPPVGQVTFGSNIGTNAGGTGLGSDFSVGFYWAAGVVSGPDDGPYMNGIIPGPFVMGTGPGSTVAFDAVDKGYFYSLTECVIPGVSSGPVTLIVVAYNGASYGTATVRSHSPAFQIIPEYGLDLAPDIGSVMPAFAVYLEWSIPVLSYHPAFYTVNGPTNLTVTAGSNVTLVAASGTSGQLYYQWRHNGTNIPGASGLGLQGNIFNFFSVSYTHSKPAASLQDAGTYDLILTNYIRSITSRVATLSVVLPPPTISGVLSNDVFVLSCAGVASQPYVLQSAPSLTPPVVWTPLVTNTTDTNGLFTFTDSAPLLLPERYYRLSTP